MLYLLQTRKVVREYCPNDGRRDFSKTNSDLNKHMNYHFRLTDNEKLIFYTGDQGGITFNRRIFGRRGPPKNNTFVANDAIFYDAAGKTWLRQICNKKAGKYDWRHIVNHANNTQNTEKEK